MTLFTRVNVVSDDLSLPIISESDIDYFLPFELSSYEHWMFNRREASLVGIAHGRSLTTGATAPVYGASFLSLSTAMAGALKSDKNDGANQTICVVYRRPATSTLRYLAGTLDATSGSSLYASGAALGGVYANQRPTAQSGPINASGGEGSWVFAALSEKANLGSTDRVLYVGGQAANKSNVAVKTIAARPIALCNGYESSVADSLIDFAEFIIFDKSMTDVELAPVYARSKLRMANIGITVQ